MCGARPLYLSASFIIEEGFALADLKRIADSMGQASREIIARWTPQTFAENLYKAAEAALNAPRPKASLLDRMLLWALIRR